jgi:hypothetical protein
LLESAFAESEIVASKGSLEVDERMFTGLRSANLLIDDGLGALAAGYEGLDSPLIESLQENPQNENAEIVPAFLVLICGTFANAQVRIHYINVGQADSILLEFRKAMAYDRDERIFLPLMFIEGPGRCRARDKQPASSWCGQEYQTRGTNSNAAFAIVANDLAHLVLCIEETV